MTVKPLLLCIIDGYGLNPDENGNGVAHAKKPNLDLLFANNPFATLITCGERVGLPDGQMGNSEVGHLNIGAGRVVDQWLVKISKGLKSDADASSKIIEDFSKKLSLDKTLHFVGLYSDGGVHSHKDHFHLLINRVRKYYSGKIALHLITDGRDVGPNKSLEEIKNCKQLLKNDRNCSIATVGGRFYYMDRDKRWERIKKAYDSIVFGKKSDNSYSNLPPQEYIKASYENKITDEFLEPNSFNSYQGVKTGDSIVFWNFREDRMREIVNSLVIETGIGFQRDAIPFKRENSICLVDYDRTFKLPIIFEDIKITNHLGEVLAGKNIPQLRVAETEKYPHVTYFFNGGIEEPYPLEERQMVPSLRDIKTYDEKPEMSAFAVKDIVVNAIRSGNFKFIVVNFANCDMVGHTALLPAVVKAVETVDTCIGEIITAIKENNWQAIFTADHGNAEQLVNYETGDPYTSHTTYPVPFVVFGAEGVKSLKSGGALCDIAPTILKLMEIEKPAEMTGENLNF